MTNQARKSWGLAAEVCAHLRSLVEGSDFWWHVDEAIRYWSIPALLSDFGLQGFVDVTYAPLTDEQMADRYRSCAATLHFGLGEGFGYPIFESLACGVPAIHGQYGGGASILQTCDLPQFTVTPTAFRYDTQHNSMRPVFTAGAWAHALVQINGFDLDKIDISHLRWENLQHPWKRWFLEGIQ